MFVNERGGAMLSERQRQIWNYLVDYVDRHGYPPTVREIGAEVGLASPSTVHAHLANLERAGMLRRDPTKPRALELVGREHREPTPVQVTQHDAVRLPLVGEIAAGSPLIAEQNVEEYLSFPSTTRGDFLLRVKGDSMIDAGILDGDLVIVERTQDARNGEIVVALVGDDESANEATVKTFYRDSDRIRLHTGDNVQQLARTLEQELSALLRGASLECLACGEFVMHARDGVVFCPECGSQLGDEQALAACPPLVLTG
jgi:repressor LexA